MDAVWNMKVVYNVCTFYFWLSSGKRPTGALATNGMKINSPLWGSNPQSGELRAISRKSPIVLCHSSGIFQVLGTDELNAYLNKYLLELDPQLDALVGRYCSALCGIFAFFAFKISILEIDVPCFWSSLVDICISATVDTAGSHGQDLLTQIISI